MTCGDSTYYATNYYPGYYPASMMRSVAQPAGFPRPTPSGPSQPLPMGTEQPSPTGVGQETFIENIIRLNKGKVGTFYFTYQGNTQWNAKTYRGIVETASPDHIIISNPTEGKRYMLLMSNLDWVEFDEEISYFVPEVPGIQTSS